MGHSRKAGPVEAQVYREIERNSDLYRQCKSVIDHPQYGKMNTVDSKKLARLVKAKYPMEELRRRQREGYFG